MKYKREYKKKNNLIRTKPIILIPTKNVKALISLIWPYRARSLSDTSTKHNKSLVEKEHKNIRLGKRKPRSTTVKQKN